MFMFENSSILVTGGTGSFGSAVIQRLLKSEVSEIRVFSRDEKKQEEMRGSFRNDRVRYYIGDVRDTDAVTRAVQGIDYVFHAAALKQVPSCEFYPIEAFKTNVLGAKNVIDASVRNGVRKVVCLSTDKAVYPVNAMGISKAMMEKIATSSFRDASETAVSVTRYGNVMASRGSVIPLFAKQLKAGQPLTITDPKMTRFIMSLREAVELVLFALEKSSSGDIFIQKSPATDVNTLARATACALGFEYKSPKIIGTRHGEKRYETLLSREELSVAEDLENYYRVPVDKRGLNYEDYFIQGKKIISNTEDYNSQNAEQIDFDVLVNKIASLNL